ncbi:MAG: SagB/ThcOx family dehydrogenase [Egibacteraceae bacterium]
MLLRRARGLIVQWQDGELTLQSYLDGTCFVVDGSTLELLDRFECWAEAEQVAASYEEYDAASVLEQIRLLTKAGLLHDEDGDGDDELLQRHWRHWSEEARYFHYGTKDAEYVDDEEQKRRNLMELLTEDAAPLFKIDQKAERLYLPRAFLPLRSEFGDVLATRRTHRTFTSEGVDPVTLSTVLHHTFAPMHFVDAGEFGTLLLKTSPAGGARHELECYVGVLNVTGVDRGLYHYCGENHSLELLESPFDAHIADRLCHGQGHCATASFVCFVTALFGRLMFKYRHPRAYRIMLLNAGHLAQTFVLVCTALGLGPFQTAAFRDSEVEEILGVDGFAEGALYVLGAGRPVPTREGMPADLRYGGTLTPLRSGKAAS